jgi:hypothetical protein
LDYFLWGHLKTVVYENLPINLDDLKNKIIIACNEFIEDEIIAATQRELLRRMEACVENNDNNFEVYGIIYFYYYYYLMIFVYKFNVIINTPCSFNKNKLL